MMLEILLSLRERIEVRVPSYRHTGGRTQRTVRKNARAQTATAFEKFLRAGSDRAIHPVTRLAFLRPVKTNSLDFEILIDQIVEIDATRDDVSSRQRRRARC